MSDLISRQDAIDALGEEPEVWDDDNDYDVGTRNQWRYDVETIKEVPSAQQWIPCSERLPEKNGNYLIQVNSTQASLHYFKVDHFNTDIKFWTDSSDRPHKKVVAWMPLPPSFKGEEE